MITPMRKEALVEHGLSRRGLLAAGVGLYLAELVGCGARPRDTKSPSMMTDFSASEAIRRMQAGELSAESYAEALLESADAEARLNAFISLDRSRILEEARRLDLLRGKGSADGLLFGLPVAVKDVINTAG